MTDKIKAAWLAAKTKFQALTHNKQLIVIFGLGLALGALIW